MPVRTCDVAIIGAGTAGLFARKAAVAAGARPLLIEQGPGGTTCVRCGCIPSKLLLSAARAARSLRQAEAFGVSPGAVRIDGRAVMQRLHRVRDDFLRSVQEQWDGIAEEERLWGQARFTGPDTLVVGEDLEVRARRIVIAVGGRPTIAPSLKGAGARVLTHETVFDLDDLPHALAVVGAGPVGIELALAFARLGVEIAVFDDGDKVGGLKDEAVNRLARDRFGQEVALHLGVKVEAQVDGERVGVSFDGVDGRETQAFDYVLAASGRAPALAALGLDRTGLELDERGVPLFDARTRRCGDSAIFIAGDANGDRPVLHEAHLDGCAAGAAATGHADAVAPAPPRFALTLTDPDIAAVGAALADLGDEAVAGQSDYDGGRMTLEGGGVGLLRLYGRRGQAALLGAEMFGPAVEHLAHLVANWVQEGAPVKALLQRPFYHPTYEEDLKTALESLDEALQGR